MKLISIITVLATVLCVFACKNDEKIHTINSSDYGFAGVKDATPAMLNMIRDARKAGKAKIVIQKGIYHFYPDRAFEKYCFITNEDAGLKSTPFPIIGFKNLEIIADSAEFIIHGPMVPFIIEESENIKLSGFSIDWSVPLNSELEVLSVNEKGHTLDIKVDCPYEIRNEELIFLKEGYEHNLSRNEYWDPKTKAVAYNSVNKYYLNTRSDSSLVRFYDKIEYLMPPDNLLPAHRFSGVQNSLKAKEISPGIVRISGHTGELPKPGWIIVCKGENSLNRMAPAIRVQLCKNISVTNITVHHAGGMGFVCERTENVTLDHFNVALKLGSGRMLTTTADATHFNMCKGLIEIKNCLFENMLDDGTNIHGSFVKVRDVIDKYTVGVHVGHFQQMGFEYARPGDHIGFKRIGASSDPFLVSKVISFEKVNQRYYLITFEDSMTDVKVGDLLDNVDWYPQVHITGCTFRNNRARSLLLATPYKTIIENNSFNSMMGAVILGSGGLARGWYGWFETGSINDCTIRNNNFGDSGYGGGNSPVISGGFDRSANDKFPIKKLVIETNTFNTFNPFILRVGGIDSLIFRNNKVKRSNNYPLIVEGNPVLDLRQINHQIVENNQIEQGLMSFKNSDN